MEAAYPGRLSIARNLAARRATSRGLRTSSLPARGFLCNHWVPSSTIPFIPMPLNPGDIAPDFELPAVAGEELITVRSRDYLGKQNLVVTFHPLDWTPT